MLLFIEERPRPLRVGRTSPAEPAQQLGQISQVYVAVAVVVEVPQVARIVCMLAERAREADTVAQVNAAVPVPSIGMAYRCTVALPLSALTGSVTVSVSSPGVRRVGPSSLSSGSACATFASPAGGFEP